MITRTSSKPLRPFISTCLRSSTSPHNPIRARALHSLSASSSSSRTKPALFPLQPRIPTKTTGSQCLVINLGQRRFSSELKFGQPVHETHPHLLKAGEITPNITALEYHLRRSRLSQLLKPNEVALIASSQIKYRSGPVFHAFHQDSDFHYLTGFLEPDSLALIEKADDDYTFTLFCLPKDPSKELWDGPRNGLVAATEVFNADIAHSIFDVPSILPPLLSQATKIYTNLPTPSSSFSFTKDATPPPFPPHIPNDLFTSKPALRTAKISQLTHRLRAIKSEAELANMRKAADISGAAFNSAMSSPVPFPSEHVLHAHLTHQMLINGCEKEAYIPVVAGGPNGLSIHYTVNNQVLRPNDLVLVDAGGQYGGYITDITRTWPVSGKFTKAQRQLYEIVLAANKVGIELCTVKAEKSLDLIHHACAQVLRDGLSDLGLDVGGDAMDTLFPHHVGHYVGLDVHDVGTWPRALRLTEGQVVTIEPGIYVPEHDERWPEEYRGLAIRVEDCVVVGKDRPDVLTKEAWKEVRDIEIDRS